MPMSPGECTKSHLLLLSSVLLHILVCPGLNTVSGTEKGLNLVSITAIPFSISCMQHLLLAVLTLILEIQVRGAT